ncbi:RICIN domain-containing protein [Stigmatella sp. ncwal1]|uniref:RICIN domain-containing protein n=1 Tax=Stigmatella ashevillensis TaxID=2995309 RepID=A0ABT5DGV2_9BACT|nr:RICIN domain-containing protein [Stigmatella ashevillena]MDC0712355.1 RICIN domain-containing protein [Stigmatella ashevillena]
MHPEQLKKWMTRSVLALGLTWGCSNAEELPVYEGEIQLFAVDHADGSHRMGYGLRTVDGQSFELSFEGEPTVRAGDQVVVRGYLAPEGRPAHEPPGQVGEVLRAESIEVLPSSDDGLATSSAALQGGTPRTLRVAILPLVFPGSSAGIDTATAQQRLATVRSYYQEISYGIWNVQGDALAPLSLARPANCNLDTINNAARAAAKSQGINLDVYAHVGFVIPTNSGLSNCACGLAWVGRPPAANSPSIGNGSLYTCTDANAFAHEFGHGFGLGHAATARCGSGVAYQTNPYSACSPDEYGNRFNTMGGGLGHMNAFQKSAMKWLDRCNTLRVSKSGTFELTPIQSASNNTQALQIATGDTVSGKPIFFWVEYRNPALASFNAGPSGYPETGAGVHIDVAQDFRSSDGDTRPLLLDLAPGYPNNHQDPRLTAGRTFQAPNGLSISVVEQNSQRAVVQVTFPGGGSGTNTCGDGSVPGSTGPQPGGTFQLSAQHSGKCLDVSNSGTTDGSNIQQWDCNGTNAQAFRLEAKGNGTYTLVNINSSKCVDVASSGTTDGSNIQLWSCNGTNAQAFSLQARTDGTGYNLVNANSGKCVEVAGAGTGSGTNVQQWSCNNGTHQSWAFSPR